MTLKLFQEMKTSIMRRKVYEGYVGEILPGMKDNRFI